MRSVRIDGPGFLPLLSAFWLLIPLNACQTLRQREPASTLLRTDSTEITIERGLNIAMVLVNTTQSQISSGGCLPNLEKKINDKWVTVHSGGMLGCDRFTLEPGGTYRETVPYFTTNIATELHGAPIDGVYRLRWRFVEGNDFMDNKARKVEAISNEFRILRHGSSR